MNINQLKKTADQMVISGKGILAADESTPTCTSRFEALGIESSAETRNKYRDMLLTTEGIEEFISGVILYDETLRQSTVSNNELYPDFLSKKGILPGIKVDMGAKQLALHPNEKITAGLDGLHDRLKEYYLLGARFAKWRAVIIIGDDMPTNSCIQANAHALARYAAICQENSIVPIVEPEVLMNGSHTIERCYQISEISFKKVFEEMDIQGVNLEGIVLKPNMVISGIDCLKQASIEEVADKTVECLKNTVPNKVPGCAFLSGGQSNHHATEHLNRMNVKYKDLLPWNLTFSYGRALQSNALKVWSGSDENIRYAQQSFYECAKSNSFATKGEYSKEKINV